MSNDFEERNAVRQRMKYFFIRMAQGFVVYDSYYALGLALHPIADTYADLQTPKNMLSFYHYGNVFNVVDGRYVSLILLRRNIAKVLYDMFIML